MYYLNVMAGPLRNGASKTIPNMIGSRNATPRPLDATTSGTAAGKLAQSQGSPSSSANFDCRGCQLLRRLFIEAKPYERVCCVGCHLASSNGSSKCNPRASTKLGTIQ